MSIGQAVSEWYALHPSIRQLWAYETRELSLDNGGDVHVVVALAPVCDSDDTSPIWLARSSGWQRELQELTGRRVHLDWIDADAEAVPCADDPQRARVCLASIAWRHIE